MRAANAGVGVGLRRFGAAATAPAVVKLGDDAGKYLCSFFHLYATRMRRADAAGAGAMRREEKHQ